MPEKAFDPSAAAPYVEGAARPHRGARNGGMMTTNRMTRSQVETMLTPLKVASSYNSNSDVAHKDATDKVMTALNDAYGAAEETDELRRQLKKALRRAVELEVQLEVAETRLVNAGSPMLLMNGFIVGPRDELHLESILPGYPVIFTDEPKPPETEKAKRPNVPGSDVPMKSEGDER